MKPKISFLNLPQELAAGVAAVLPELPLETATDGIAVTVERGDVLALRRVPSGISLTYSRKSEFFRALSMLADFINGDKDELAQKTSAELMSYMADMSRNAVYNIPTAKKMIRKLAICGYNSLMLYTEDTYEIPEYPYFGYMRGRFSKEELKELDDYGDMLGIELIPCIQTLAHLNATLGWNAHRSMVDIDDILRVGAEDAETYRFVEAMFKTCRECFRSKRINIGMDEAHNLGRGTYLDKYGATAKPDIMIAHLRRVIEIAKKYDFAPMMWSDMFFRMQFGGHYYVKEGNVDQRVIDLVPPEVQLIYWDYYTTTEKQAMFAHMIDCHKQFKNNKIAFAGGVSKWYGFVPLNRFSITSTRMQMDICNAEGMSDIIVTAWGDAGGEASQFSIMPSLLYYAERTYMTEEPSQEWMDARCKQCFGIGYEDLLKLDLPAEVGMTDGKIIQPANYLLFNDPLNGLMNTCMEPDQIAGYYRAHTPVLAEMAKHAEWGYVYDTLYRLSDVLTLKSDLSVRIRRAYKANDRNTLAAIAKDEIPVILEKLEALWLALRRQWLAENKSFGLDVQEIRLGGLRQRMISAQMTLQDYLDGRVEKIEELEAENLPFERRGKKSDPNNPYMAHHTFASIITAAVMT